MAAIHCLTTQAHAQNRDRVEVTTACAPTPTPHVYACTWDVANARTGAPVEGAGVVITADMPSMPMAHDVPPVTAKAGDAAGRYTATLPLEMHGDRAVRVTATGPVRDLVVHVQVLRFDASGAAPRRTGTVGKTGGSGAGSGVRSGAESGAGER